MTYASCPTQAGRILNKLTTVRVQLETSSTGFELTLKLIGVS